MNAITPRRCVIYTRKSTAAGLEQDFNSLDAQRESCEAFIKSQAHQGWILSETFEDGGFTGASIDRPGFQALLKAVERRQVDVVIVYKVDRLSRSLFDFVKVMERFNTREVAFVSVTQNFSTADAMGRLTLNMLMSFAEFERAMIIERTRDKIAAARRKGKWTGGNVPFGYDVRSKRLVVNDAEACLVRELFWKYLTGCSALDLAAWMNSVKQDPGGRIRPSRRPWAQARVLGILRNRVYLGEVHSHGVFYPGEHLPLVEREVFDQVQIQLASQNRRSRPRSPGGVILIRASPSYLLRGLLRCGSCSRLMTTATVRRENGPHRYYRCLTRNTRGKGACPTRQIPAEALEVYVLDQVLQALRRGTLTQAQGHVRLAALEERVSSVQSRLVQVKSVADRKWDHITQCTQLERELQGLEAELEQARWLCHLLGHFEALWSGLTEENQRRLLHLVVQSVLVDEATDSLRVVFVNLEEVG